MAGMGGFYRKRRRKVTATNPCRMPDSNADVYTIFAPKGQPHTSPGQSAAPPWVRRPTQQTLKGRNNTPWIVCFAPSGLPEMLIAYPGRRCTLPWADIFQAFQAGVGVDSEWVTLCVSATSASKLRQLPRSQAPAWERVGTTAEYRKETQSSSKLCYAARPVYK